MDAFDNDILNLQDVFKLLLKPRDITKDEFINLVWFLSIRDKSKVMECSAITSIAIESGLAESNGDVRRMIKAQALSIGRRKITDINAKADIDDFFDTGIDGLKWSTIRHGKKISQFILIQNIEGMYPNDPWFGLTYEEWNEQRL
jgi:tyrosyl-tRNA synthetase